MTSAPQRWNRLRRVGGIRQLALLCLWGLVAGACGADGGRPTGASSPATTAPIGRSANPAVSGVSTATPFQQIITRVDLGDDYFAPAEITVPFGTTVSWQIATGENNHDVASSDGLFRSNYPMNRGVDVFTYTFRQPGEYRYVCTFHLPGMVGKVVVK